MGTYNDVIKGNAKVEMIHVSLDKPDAARSWATKHKFPWPTVLKDDINGAGLAKFRPRGVPHYLLIDKDGKLVETGKSKVFSKIQSLR